MLVFGVLSLSTSAIFVRLAHAPSAVTAFFRLLFASLLLLPFLLGSKQNRQQVRALSPKQWGLAVVSGLLLALHYVLWFESLRYTSVASATVIVTLQPIFSITIGYFVLKERFSRQAIFGCLIAMLGCLVIGWGDFQISTRSLLGDLMAFLAAGIISIYFFIGQNIRQQLSAVSYSVIGYLSSSAFLACYAVVEHNDFVGYPRTTWLAFGGLALISTVCGQFVFNWILKWLPATVISVSILGEIIGTCILAYFILHEVISLQQGVGIIVILIGLARFFLSPKVEQKG